MGNGDDEDGDTPSMSFSDFLTSPSAGGPQDMPQEEDGSERGRGHDPDPDPNENDVGSDPDDW